MQFLNAKEYVIPFIETGMKIGPGTKVLEVGCGEAGVLKAFFERGCDCMGIELHGNRIDLAKEFMPIEIASGRMTLLVQNIYDVDFTSHKGTFDLIVLKDVIEHIPDQEKLMAHLKEFLNPKGLIYFGFPPWYMPFGGHQQVVPNKVLSKLPWYHLLPKSGWLGLLKLGGVKGEGLEEMAGIWDTGISTARFERIVKNNGMKIYKTRFWFINPIYSYKFGLKARTQSKLIIAIPFLRDFITTAAFYLTGR